MSVARAALVIFLALSGCALLALLAMAWHFRQEDLSDDDSSD